MFHRIRAALLAPALVAAAIALPATSAHAYGSCGSPESTITTYKNGSVNGYYYDPDTDWYRVDGNGATVIGLTTTSTTGTVYLNVWDAACGQILCTTWTGLVAGECAVTSGGPLYVEVFTNSSSYVPYYVTATSAPAVGGTDCSTTSGVQTCVTKEVGATQQTVNLYSARTYTAATHHVAGYVDVYRFPVAGGANVTLPCVVLVVNSTTEDPCGANDGTFVTRLATLTNTNVNQPGVALDVPLATVKVCTARYTVTVDAIGVEDVPAYSIC